MWLTTVAIITEFVASGTGTIASSCKHGYSHNYSHNRALSHKDSQSQNHVHSIVNSSSNIHNDQGGPGYQGD